MQESEIVQKLRNADYIVITSCNEIFKDGYHLGEVACSKESKYLGKVLLFPWGEDNREISLKLEKQLINEKIPFKHQKN